MHSQLMRWLVIGGWWMAASAAEAPQIGAEMRARFWRAQAALMAAQDGVRRVDAEMARVCGDGFVVGPDGAGEPSCQVKR